MDTEIPGHTLGTLQVERALTAVRNATPQQAAKTEELLRSAKSPTEQALVLKAVAARMPRFGAADGDQAMREVSDFAQKIRGLSPTELADRTFPGQVTTDDPTSLTQKFTASCGPTSIQTVMAAVDPVYANSIYESNAYAKVRAGNEITRQQEEALERNSQTAELYAKSQIDSNFMSAAKRLDTASADTVQRYLDGRDYDQTRYNSTMKTLEGQMGADFLGTDAARLSRETALSQSRRTLINEQAQTMRGLTGDALNSARRDYSTLLAYYNGDKVTPEQEQRVQSQILPSLVQRMGSRAPSQEVMDNIRELKSRFGPLGLGATQITRELQAMKLTNMVGPASVHYDRALADAWSRGDKEMTPEFLSAITPHDFNNPGKTNQQHIQALVDEVYNRAESGRPVVIDVQWENFGGHFMSVLDARQGADGGRELLIHNSDPGNTKLATRWVDTADIVNGDWSDVGVRQGLFDGIFG